MTGSINAATVIAAAAVAVVLFAAVRHIIKEKKRGTACIGCPMAGSCRSFGRKNTGECGAKREACEGSPKERCGRW